MSTCAVESKWEKYVEAGDSFVPSIEVTFSHGESVAQMESAVHVWVGECFEILRLFVGFTGEILVSIPNGSGPLLEGNQFVSTCCVLHRIN